MLYRTTLVLLIVGVTSAIASGADPILQTALVSAELSATSPRIVRLTHRSSGTVVGGPGGSASDWRIHTAEGTVRLSDCRTLLDRKDDSLNYTVRTGKGVRLNVSARLEGDTLTLGVENIDGPLRGIDFGEPVVEVGKTDGPWQLATADMMQGGRLEKAFAPADSRKRDWAILYTGRVALTIRNSIVRKPVVVTRGPEVCGLGSNGWHYALKDGQTAPVYQVSIGLLGDLNNDATVDWQDGAIFHQRHIPDRLARILQTHLLGWVGIESSGESPGMNATFPQVQDIIRRQYYLTGGEPTAMGLAGWCYWGWDSEYPAVAEASRRAGGNAALVALCKDAWRWGGSQVSLNINFDDAYKHSPAWDMDIMCTNPDGSPRVFMYWNGGLAYNICPYKDVQTGKAFDRIETMLDFGTAGSCYIDTLSAGRIANKSSSGPGGEIHWMDNLVAGKYRIADYYWTHGIKIWSEKCMYPFVGRLAGCLNNDETGLDASDAQKIPLPAFILKGRANNFWSATRYGRAGRVLLGIYPNIAGHVGSPNDDHLDRIFLQGLVCRSFLSLPMRRFSFDGKRFVVHYTDQTRTSMQADGSDLKVIFRGRKIADDTSMFVPRPRGGYWAYASSARNVEYPLPAGWHAGGIRMFALNREGAHQEVFGRFAVNGDRIRLTLPARVPYLLTAGPDLLPRRIEGYARRARTVLPGMKVARRPDQPVTPGRAVWLEDGAVVRASEHGVVRIPLPDAGKGRYVAHHDTGDGLWVAHRRYPDPATYRDKRKRPKDRVLLVGPDGKVRKQIPVLGPVCDILHDPARKRLYVAAGVFNFDGVQVVDLTTEKVIGIVPLVPEAWGSDLRLALAGDVLYVAAPQTQNLAAIRLEADWPDAATAWSDRIFTKPTDPRDPEAALDEYLRIRWNYLAAIHELGMTPIDLTVDGPAVLCTVAAEGLDNHVVRIAPVEGPTAPEPTFADPFPRLARALSLPRERIVATNLPGNALPWWLTLPREKHHIIPEPRPEDAKVWYNVGPRYPTVAQARRHAALIVALKCRNWARSLTTMPLVRMGEKRGLPRGKLRSGHDYWMVGYCGVRDHFTADDVMDLPNNRWYLETIAMPDGQTLYRAGLAATVPAETMDRIFDKTLAAEADWYRAHAAQSRNEEQKKLYVQFAELFSDARKSVEIDWMK